MKKRKTYRAPDLYLHRVARLNILSGSTEFESSTEVVVDNSLDGWDDTDPSGSNETVKENTLEW